MIDALTNIGIPYQIVKVRPFIHTIEPDINPDSPIVIGSTTLVQIALNRGWPVFFNENFDYRVQIEKYGEEMLNHDSIIGPFSVLSPYWDRFFVRPPEDSKLFAGTTMSREEFQLWKEDTAFIHSDGFTSLTPETVLMAAPLKVIGQEIRLFIIDGKVVTGSVYRVGGRGYQSGVVDTDIIEYAEWLAKRWQPARAYCLDVAVVASGLKVIEINCIHSAGFYKSDVSKVVQGLEYVRTNTQIYRRTWGDFM